MANRGVTAGTALYLYGVTKSSDAPAKVAVEGIDGVHPVQPIACGGFTCWVSAVDRETFAGEINRNMENLEWLALHSVRHQQAVAEIAARATIVPTRFGTIFSSEQALRKDVDGRKAALEKVFARISGADEWGVKVFVEPEPAPEIAKEVHSGKEYLQQKAARMKRRLDRDDSGLRDLATELDKIAVASAPTGKVSGGLPNLLWQAAFLVPRSRHAEWDKTLKKFVNQWGASRRIEVNGPWPPYSFVSDAE